MNEGISEPGFGNLSNQNRHDVGWCAAYLKVSRKLNDKAREVARASQVHGFPHKSYSLAMRLGRAGV